MPKIKPTKFNTKKFDKISVTCLILMIICVFFIIRYNLIESQSCLSYMMDICTRGYNQFAAIIMATIVMVFHFIFVCIQKNGDKYISILTIY